MCISEINAHVKSLLDKVGLENSKNTVVSSLSLGNKRKVEFAVALVGKPRVIILDEPTVGMDPDANRRIWSILADLKKEGVSIVLVTHMINQATSLCDEMAIMHLGRMRCIGSVNDLKKKFSKGWELNIIFKKNTNQDIELVLNKIKSHHEDGLDTCGTKLQKDTPLTLNMVQDTVKCFLKEAT